MKREKSRQLFQRAQELIPGGVNSPVRAFRSVDGDPFIVSHGRGAYLIDVDGNAYVDYINSWGPLVLGHAFPEVVQSIETQVVKGTSYGACSALEGELAELVTRMLPSLEMIRFVNSGTEAGMSVVRLARAFTKRSKILKFAGCYHGHFDAMLVQAGSGVATLGLPDSAGVLPTSTADTLVAPFNDLPAVEAIFREHGADIAAIILEPVVGNAGLILPRAEFLPGLRALSERQGSLLIFDEVMTGFRVHLGGAQTLYGVKPDLTMLGKVIGGGLPVGAFGGRREVMSMLAPLGPVYQAGTLSGNPLAMAAGLATLRAWSKENVFARVANDTRRLVQAFRDAAHEHGIAICAEAVGTMFGFFFQSGPVRNYAEAKRSDVERFREFFHRMLERGVYFAPSQFEAGFVSAAHHGQPLDETIEALKEVFPLIVDSN